MPDYDSNRLCYVDESRIHGLGLFARRDIRADSCVQSHQLFTEAHRTELVAAATIAQHGTMSGA